MSAIHLINLTKYSAADVNQCEAGDADKCWEITPATLATPDTSLNEGSFLRALGEFRDYCLVTAHHVTVRVGSV